MGRPAAWPPPPHWPGSAPGWWRCARSPPGRRAPAPGPAPAPPPRKATKTARFLAMATERHGSLASIPLDAVAGLSADLARWVIRPVVGAAPPARTHPADLDFRATGGYIVAPPSQVGGKPYLVISRPGGHGTLDWAAVTRFLGPSGSTNLRYQATPLTAGSASWPTGSGPGQDHRARSAKARLPARPGGGGPSA